MKKPLVEIISRIARGAAPATAVVTSLAAPLAQAASGDLDPSFADHGRLGPIAELTGSARSVEALLDGGALLGGGGVEAQCNGYWCYYEVDFEASNFVSSVTEQGGLDASYGASLDGNIEVAGIARQADAKVVAAGRRIDRRNSGINHLVVFRLSADGSLDSTFGADGIVELDANSPADHRANDVIVDPDGRIVVVGVRAGTLIALRLNPDGAVDASFGSQGFYSGPTFDYGAGARIVRLSSGDYRLTSTHDGACSVIALTAAGSVDESYGDIGFAPISIGLAFDVACRSLVAQDDERLVISGNANDKAFALRLLASGAADPSFSAPDVATQLSDASAISVAADGKILVGGGGVSGAAVMRLQATGQLDASFGEGGVSLIDLPTAFGATAYVDDLAVWPDGSVIAAGGAWQSRTPQPFAVRLLGDAGGESPGVLGIEQSYVDGTEGEDAVVKVRRTGGKSGAVSVAYHAVPIDQQAVAGQDFEAVEGVLHWANGDSSERSIAVPVMADAGPGEDYEQFQLSLSDPQGAGLGTRNAAVTIQADGSPAGLLSIDSTATATESSGLQLWVYRSYYGRGDVCVTATPQSGTATAGEDFNAHPVKVCWLDQDFDAKLVEIKIKDDKTPEDSESFTVALSNATAGAAIGPQNSATVSIASNDAVTANGGNGNGGGGAAGLLSLLLLGFGEAIRAARRRLVNRT
jgi:uncharacterized delta-60 repeat protein